MNRKLVTPQQWLERHVRKLSDLGTQVSQIDPDVHHSYSVHTSLKLSALEHAVEVFSPIARRRVDGGRSASSVYIDLFAGCGVTRTYQGDFVAGSPLIAATVKRPFDKLILVEKDSGKADTLRRRLESLQGVAPFDVIRGDCNQVVEEIIKKAGRASTAFLCVDPEGMDVDWKTIETIANKIPATDLFINFTRGAERVASAYVKRGTHGEILRRFTGEELSRLLSQLGNETVLDLYEGKLRNDLGKEIGGSSAIVDERGVEIYRLLMYTRLTSGGSPYSGGYKALLNRLDQVTVEDAKGALNIVKGRALDTRL